MSTSIADKSLVQPAVKSEKADFLGYSINVCSFDETLKVIDGIVASRIPIQHCVLNSCKLRLLKNDPVLQKVVKDCGMIQADGMSIVWAAQLLGLPKIPRVTGIDLMEALVARAEQLGYRLFFLGAKAEVLNSTLKHYQARYPKLQVAGSHHGYFENDDEVVKIISDSKADILFVAMSSPAKEWFISRNIARMNVPFCMGVGGSFDVISGLVKRAPLWVQNSGFEWLYRTVQEPSRLWKRYTYSHFNLAWSLVRAWLGKK